MTQENTISLLVTSGNGPAECCQAVAHVLDTMRGEAAMLGLALDISETPAKHDVKSAVVVVHGMAADRFGLQWCGTVQWVAKSQFRPHHKRQNWFVGVFALKVAQRPQIDLRAQDVTFDSFRAGGPGGQHQNTTDSAVRATHQPSGITVVAREMRSQHRNKALALERLQQVLEAREVADKEDRKVANNQMHNTLERGNPLRRFKGAKFKEIKVK